MLPSPQHNLVLSGLSSIIPNNMLGNLVVLTYIASGRFRGRTVPDLSHRTELGELETSLALDFARPKRSNGPVVLGSIKPLEIF